MFLEKRERVQPIPITIDLHEGLENPDQIKKFLSAWRLNSSINDAYAFEYIDPSSRNKLYLHFPRIGTKEEDQRLFWAGVLPNGPMIRMGNLTTVELYPREYSGLKLIRVNSNLANFALHIRDLSARFSARGLSTNEVTFDFRSELRRT